MAQTGSTLHYPHPPTPDVSSLLTAGYSALAAGDLRQAEALFRRAVKADVRSGAAWRALAETQIGVRRAICLQWVILADQAALRTAVPPPVATERRQQPRRISGLYRRALVAALSIVGALTILAIGSDLAYRNRVLPGVSVGPIAVGNQPLTTIEQTLSAQQPTTRMIELRAGERVWRVPLQMLVPNQAAEAAAVLRSYGHEQDVWQRTATRARALLGIQAVVVTPVASSVAVRDVVAAISAQISQPARDAEIVSTAQGWTLITEQIGTAIDQAAVAAKLTQLVEAHAWEPQTTPLLFEIVLSHPSPQRSAVELRPALAELRQLQTQPLELSLGEQRWTVDRSMLMTVDTASPSRLMPSEQAIARELEALAAAVARPPQPSQLERAGDRVRALVLGQPGRALDRKEARQRMIAALVAGTARVDLPVYELPPTPGEAEQLGLIAEIGRGDSQFLTYSSPERDANVQTGGNDIDGRLIAPGEEFSFNAAVGTISEEKGYRWGEAIEAGTLIPSLGGGICQVSTTVFRAAFWSGLEIVERHHHSWRLPWYEVDAPPGMDATIALGGPDLRFRNNTGRYVLIKVETDLAQKRQTVILYGTPDGRKVEMEPLQNGNIGVQRRVLSSSGQTQADTFVSYYSQ